MLEFSTQQTVEALKSLHDDNQFWQMCLAMAKGDPRMEAIVQTAYGRFTDMQSSKWQYDYARQDWQARAERAERKLIDLGYELVESGSSYDRKKTWKKREDEQESPHA